MKRVKNPRLKVVRQWMKNILSGVHYLHEQGVIHGRINGQSIYINSGGIKIGDMASRYITSYKKFGELINISTIKGSKVDKKFDVFCIGILVLEIMCVSEPYKTFSNLL